MGRHVLFAMRNIILFSIALFSLYGCGSNSSSSGLTAETILAQMKQTYSSCQTYLDTGVVTTTFIQSSGNWIDEKPFLTAFIRSDRFRFEYQETHSSVEYRYIVWRNGADVLSWWDVKPGIGTGESLDMAIAGATGVSSGSAHIIPALLLPNEISGRQLSDITEARRIDDAEIDSVNCYRIQGKFANDPITIWIEANTFLVRRIETQHTFPDFSTETVTTYTPVVNGVVTDDMLAFNPPLANGDVGDRLVITNVTPTSVSSNQTTTFTIEVSYTLSSDDTGVLRVADQEVPVSKGTGTHIFDVAAMPVDAGSYSYFMVRVTLYDQQSLPLAYQEKFIIVALSAQASMSPKAIVRELRNRQRVYQ